MGDISFLSMVLIGIGLAMDVFSVSLAGGAGLRSNIVKTALITGGMFGFFQFIMPIIGFFVGIPFASFLQTIGGWIIAGLFFVIGGKMIYDVIKGEEKDVNLISLKILFLLSIATSIDALAVGVSFGLTGIEIFLPSIIIGIISFLFGFVGVVIGHKLSIVIGSKMEIAGGIILIFIGFKFIFDMLV